jgi:heme/copper-type cytochrome/quinol oxidase subunit 2
MGEEMNTSEQIRKQTTMIMTMAIVSVVANIVIICIFTVILCRVRGQAIENGFAEYHQTTGEWQWKEVKK